jgi:AcrR family transcriptional regulator
VKRTERDARRRLPRTERRTLIVRSAREAFAQRGFQATSLNSVARGAGVTKGLLYHHFPSKSALFVGVFEEEAGELLQRMRAAQETGPSVEDQLRATIDAFFTYVQERPFAPRLLFREPDLEDTVIAAHQRLDRKLVSLLVDLMGADATLLSDDPDRDTALEVFAQMVRTGLDGLTAWWQAHPAVERSALVERAMQLVWSGLSALSSPDGDPPGA